jgi:Flp pilus assembly pilin Flp
MPRKQRKERTPTMNTMLLKVYIKFQDLISREGGQDMVEYALMVALLSFGWVAGVKAMATALNNAFGNMSSTIGSYTG